MSREDVLKKYSEQRQTCEVWTRVMGYYRPRYTSDGDSRYNIGKQSEYNERKWYKE